MSIPASRIIAAFAVLCFGLAACDGNERDTKRLEASGQNSRGVRGDVESLENSRQTVVELLRHETYEGAHGPSACGDQCARQTAGFAWAKENDIFEGRACRGDSAAFIEGCRAYADEIKTGALKIEVSKESE
jgi:hypothetical protein